jgi:2-polyprenyl-3-methyl-5-hydroxy-6-metoxy-1,4-benzoquinol methylase
MATTPDAADWRAANRTNWDERVPIQVAGPFYDLPGFVAGRDTLRDFELAEVGDVSGKTLLHLQCHIGLDTLSWSRRGAVVTGLDFSAAAVDVASGVHPRAKRGLAEAMMRRVAAVTATPVQAAVV